MALNFPFRRLTTRSAPRTPIMKCVDFLPSRFAFAKTDAPNLQRRGNVQQKGRRPKPTLLGTAPVYCILPSG